MRRGHNPGFLIGGIKSIFKRNWGIDIDSHEIDLKLTYGENFGILMDKYVHLNVPLDDLL